MTSIRQVYEKVLELYPFLTQREERSFVSESKSLLAKYSVANTSNKKLSIVRSLLNLLNNRHADIKEVRSRKAPHGKVRSLKPRIELQAKQRILFLAIPSWSKGLGEIQHELIGACVKNRGKYDSILIDVRENSGGNSRIAHKFASIFFNKTIKYGTFISRNGRKLKKEAGILRPNRKFHIDVPIVILISKKCFSSNELFLAPFKVSKRAVLIGERTAGGSANPLSQEFLIGKKKMIARIPRWRFFLKGERKPIEETKIEPTVTYKKKNIISFAERYLKRLVGMELR
ncbi:MAG: S41 family peptidase [Minisyncoccia bacterium]